MILHMISNQFLTLFQAVNQLCSHFEAYRDVPKITELREKFKNIKKILKSHVFSDFSRYITIRLFGHCGKDTRLVPVSGTTSFWLIPEQETKKMTI